MAKKTDKVETDNLLVEVLTEELPPKSLGILGRAFTEALCSGLVLRGLLADAANSKKILATPRRLAAVIPGVRGKSADRQTEVSGPPVKAPPEAVAGFARKNGIAVDALEQRDTPKGTIYVARVTVEGVTLDTVLAEIVSEALRKLPISKAMRWGDGDAQFVRPVHSVVMMHGKRVVPGRVFGLEAGNRTQGHRFLGKSPILLRDAGAYEDLLDEVTALVELPVVYAGGFDAAYLEVPQECLILTMRQNQKYFPLFGA